MEKKNRRNIIRSKIQIKICVIFELDEFNVQFEQN